VQNLWQCYPLLKDGLDQLARALGEDDKPEVGRLLGPSGVTLPDGTGARLTDLLAALERDLEQATAAARRVATARRKLLPCAERLSDTLATLDAEADSLGRADDVALAAAHRLVDDLRRHLLPDPLGVDTGRAELEVEAVKTRFHELMARRDGLPDALAAARSALEELRETIADGAEALALTQEKLTECRGLLRPLDPSAVDGDARALAPWLDRLEAAAARGDWQAASAGLERWRTVADGWLANARRVAEANRAPLRRRNELRGLLDSYRAKAAAAGLGADAGLTGTYDDAHRLLHTAPCDLDAAEEKVREYRQAVNRTRPGP
jgi:hypothetical protein